MKILVLQHAEVEHAGKFRRFLTEDGHSWDTVHLYAGGQMPGNMDGYDALWVLGGPMDVWQEDEFPWLVDEKAFIKAAVVDRGTPFFGLCLGHQLLVEVLGGRVGPSVRPEIGVMDVAVTEDGANGIFLDGVPEVFPALQWHSAEVQTLPGDCDVLATSPACLVQAIGWQGRAYSVQFHLELEDTTVTDWVGIPAYADALEQALGDGGAARLERDCSAGMSEFETLAERIYINWLQTAAMI